MTKRAQRRALKKGPASADKRPPRTGPKPWRRILLKMLVAAFFLFGIMPLFFAWRGKVWFQASAILLSLFCFGAAELVASGEHVDRLLRLKVAKLANSLFFGVLFLALAFLTPRWLHTSWGAQLELGLLMLAAAYYSLTFMQLVFLRDTEPRK